MNLGTGFFVMLAGVLAGAVLLAGWRGLVIATVAGVIGLVRGAMLRRLPARDPGVDPHLVPDPALGWLLAARGALGVWVGEPSQDPELLAEVDALRQEVAELHERVDSPNGSC